MKPVELSTIQIEVAIRQNEAFLASVPARKERIANTEFKMEWQRHQEERHLENKIQSAEANLFAHRQSLANWTQRELWIVDEIREAAEKKDAVKTTRKASLEAKIEKHMAKYHRLDKSTAKRIAELPTWVPAERIARAEENQWNTHQEELRRLQFEEKQLREKLALMF
jgi:hypothetical protein